MRIRTQLVLAFVFFGLLPMALMALLSFEQARRALLDAHQELLREHAFGVQARVSMLLQTWLDETIGWAASEATLRSLESQDTKFVEEFARVELSLAKDVLALSVLDEEHRVVMALLRGGKGTPTAWPEMKGKVFEPSAWVWPERLIDEQIRADVMRVPELPQPGQQRVLVLSTPIVDEFEKTLGTLVALIDLQRAAQHTLVRGRQGEAEQLNQRYSVVFGVDGRSVMCATDLGGSPLQLADILGEQERTEGVFDSGMGIDGQEALVFVPHNLNHRILGLMGWHVAALTPHNYALRAARRLGLSVLVLLSIIAGLAATLGGAAFRRKTRTIDLLSRRAVEITETGNLTAEISVPGRDEIAALGDSFRKVVGKQRNILKQVKELAQRLTAVTRKAQDASNLVSLGTSEISSRVEDTSNSAQHMLNSLHSLEDRLQRLASSVHASRGAVGHIKDTNEAVTGKARLMENGAEEAVVALEKMSSAADSASRRIGEFADFVAETSSSMTEMDASIREVTESAERTAQLSEEACSQAEIGTDALRETLRGVEDASKYWQSVSEVIFQLNSGTEEIGTILGVIESLAAQTRLLSLNASIIASQAGDKGSGFAVIADEIKNLAVLTNFSTQEIGDLIRRIQQEGSNAVQAIRSGEAVITRVVGLGAEADLALNRILDSSQKATHMCRSIALGTREQVRASAHVTSLVHRVVHGVEELRSISREQSSMAFEARETMEGTKTMSQEVRAAAIEQAHKSAVVAEALNIFADISDQVQQAQRMQGERSHKVLQSVQAIYEVARGLDRSAENLRGVITSVEEAVDYLLLELGNYRV